jgi:adenosylhomocysteine nucleosidase
VIAALDDEVRIIRSRMSVDSRIHLRPSLFVRGTYEQSPVLLVRSGIGKSAMESAARYMAENFGPELVLHVGYCGGAAPDLQPGDFVLGDPIVDAATGERFAPDAAAAERAQTFLKAQGARARRAGLVTVDAVARQPFDKAFLGTQHESVAIDMESSALARVMGDLSIPFVVVRSVLDPLDYEFPDLENAMDDEGKTDGVALASHLVRRPADILKLPRIEYFASQARNAITSLIEGWLKEGSS